MKKTHTKFLSILISLTMILSVFPMLALNVSATENSLICRAGNIIPDKASNFDSAVSPIDAGWGNHYGSPNMSVVDLGNPGKCLKVVKPASGGSYASAALNLAPYIDHPGTYTLLFDYSVTSSSECQPFTVLIRTDKQYSFARLYGDNYYGELSQAKFGSSGVWYTYTATLTFTEADFASKNKWDLCLHQIHNSVSEIYIDNVKVIASESANIIPESSSSFDNVSNVNDTMWTESFGSVTTAISADGKDGNCFKFTKNSGSSYSFHTAAINIKTRIDRAGTYKISFDYKANNTTAEQPFSCVIRTDKQYSFCNFTNYRGLKGAGTKAGNQWYSYEDTFTVSDADVNASGWWKFGFHMIAADVTNIKIDNFRIILIDDGSDYAHEVGRASTWTLNEAVFVAKNTYSNPYKDVTLDLVLTNGTVTYTVPAFWDGSNIWRARFVCTEPGTWTYYTDCSNTLDGGLHNQTGTVICTPYAGTLDIYRHGFVKTGSTKYFTYADGTPFFYLGDTHWGMGSEPVSNIKTVVKKRVQQNFTVIQSEPIGAGFNAKNGITQEDIDGFHVNDEKFDIIASYGLCHSNAEFFFPSDMKSFINNNGGWSNTPVGTANENHSNVTVYDLSDSAKEALDLISRYWVARYGAYPVFWTLGQEVDNDFYWDRSEYNSHMEWSYVNNPYVYVAERIAHHDAYSHPLTAHQEYSGSTAASDSAFRDCSAHTWYASQWSQSYNVKINQTAPMDYWQNGQGKPVVLYEGKYCYLWTKNFGARVQGWMAYLSGMYGAAWGGQDTWCYLSSYGEDEDSTDGVDIITAADKVAATWESSLEYPSTYQLGYLHEFMSNLVGNWYDLVPRFDYTEYFTPENNGVFPICASANDSSKAVVYFYNFSDTTIARTPNATPENAVKTGVLGHLTANASYNYIWFNPVTGQIDSAGSFTASSSGTWNVTEKETCDMALYVCRANASCAHSNTVIFGSMNSTCARRGHGAYTYCADCNSIISGSLTASPLLPHQGGANATCTAPQVCRNCHAIINDALGHDFENSSVPATCTEAGKVDHICTRCRIVETDNISALNHAETETVRISVNGAYYYVVTNAGADKLTPFKTMSMSGDSKQVSFYLFNDTDKTITTFSLGYRWGYYAYPANGTLTRIPNTCWNGSLAPHNGIQVTLTVPKNCIMSNKSGYLTDGSTDSNGEIVSYEDLGLRIMFGGGNATGNVYITCINSDGVEAGNINACLSKTACFNDEPVALLQNTAVPNYVNDGLTACGFSKIGLFEHDCMHKGHSSNLCVHCSAEMTQTALEDYGAHTPGAEATCLTAQVCEICGQTMHSALGHDFVLTSTAPATCEAEGTKYFACTRCNATKTERIASLGHNDKVTSYIAPTCDADGFEISACTRCGRITSDTIVPALSHKSFETVGFNDINGSYLVTRPGVEYSPFKFVDMGDENEKEIHLYLYNGTNKKLTSVTLNYNWGFYAYPDADNLTRIPNTAKSLELMPGQGIEITLTLPRQAIYSNLRNNATDGSSDSLGQLIDYHSVGLRFMFDGAVNDGTLYVSGLNEATLNYALSQAGANGGRHVNASLISNKLSVPEDLVQELERIGYIGTRSIADCIDGFRYGDKCVHCEGVTENIVSLPATGHHNVDVAKITLAGTRNYVVSKSGSSRVTPFKFSDMGNEDSKLYRFLVYNDTNATLTGATLCYNWGYLAYPSADQLVRISGTYSSERILPGEYAVIELTVPKMCYFSNQPGQLTQGAYDSLGEQISYKDFGIKFGFSNTADGSLYVTCLNDPAVTVGLSATGSMSAQDTFENVTRATLLPENLQSIIDYNDAQCLFCENTACARYTLAGQNLYIVSTSGANASSLPFSDLVFEDGETEKEVQLLIKNNTTATVTWVSLNYNWGHVAYADENLTPITSARCNVNLAPGEETVITLTVPRECYFSNLVGSLTAGAYDSLGEKVSYDTMGIRYMFAGTTFSGTMSVSCLNDETVTANLAGCAYKTASTVEYTAD